MRPNQICMPSLFNTQALITPLHHLKLMTVTGEDSMKFLQSQLSNDIERLNKNQACFTAYCSAKGRMLASMVFANISPETIVGFIQEDIAPSILKRLGMFVLRSKVKLALQDTEIYGVSFPLALVPTDLGSDVWQQTHNEWGTWIAAPSTSDVKRWWWIPSPSTEMSAMVKHYHLTIRTTPDMWNAAEILAGFPWITEPLQELYIPQHLNFDVLDGINFKKGCYPGQEIVARTHYLGSIKRRMLIASTDTPQVVGADIFYEGNPDSPAGRIIASQMIDHDHGVALVDVTLNDSEHGKFYSGPQLQGELVLTAPPYSLDKPNQ